ncbi:MAG TPA: DUF1566 domain-containing protein [Frateuria sp.]|uniref:Lcl C-terminal domain-containing protein n=1 Tax=Frateuria sp. TaxID=2211372 RepID=UPI002D7F0BAA|nr:DUF1566 domain-containing protein [Frateuria sp.]HET6807230.1 DUF1566 domain-containing protein [Frateuria sp.]
MKALTSIRIQHLSIHLAESGTLLDAIPGISVTTGDPTNAARAPRFSSSKDDTVITDHKTGLQWAAEESAERMTFAAAEKHFAALRLGGFDDWRLPDLEELESIRDLTRHEPCIDTGYFKSNSGWVWSRTPCAWSSDCAWIVSFYNGLVHGLRRSGSAFVRAVRRVSPAGQ